MTKVKNNILVIVVILVLGFTGFRMYIRSNVSVSGVTKVSSVKQTVGLIVTTNNGKKIVYSKKAAFTKGDSVLLFMDKNLNVVAAKGFVQSINGVVASTKDKTAWFYKVNGKEAMVVAGSYKLKVGDKVEWNLQSY